MSNHLTFGPITVIDAPEVGQIIKEVFDGDCYHINEIPEGSTVIDVGAFYGEFSLMCAVLRGCSVLAYEPSPETFSVLLKNLSLNGEKAKAIKPHDIGVSNFCGEAVFSHWPLHPGGSGFREIPDSTQSAVKVVPIADPVLVAEHRGRPIVVKLDCEGSEREIFSDIAWLKKVQMVAMEWHNCDGQFYRGILESKGFKVTTDGDVSRSGGILIAHRN